MMNTYNIEFEVTKGGIRVIRSDRDFAFVGGVVRYRTADKVEALIHSAKGESKNVEVQEFCTGTGYFIRISKSEVQFGQYLDESLAEVEQFKDFIDEGEKIFGSISPEGFINVAEHWLDFLIHPKTLELQQKFREELRRGI